MTGDYTSDDVARALAEVGVVPGDVVFSHSSIGFLGLPAGGRGGEHACSTIVQGVLQAVGPEGTLVKPTFTYSWCKGQVFDPGSTPSACGMLSEWVRKHPQAQRSHDPIFAVSALGKRAVELTRAVGDDCFGQGSIWQRLWDADAIIVNINLDASSTFQHWCERQLEVPYRYDKVFAGTIRVGDTKRSGQVRFNCQDLNNPDTVAGQQIFDRLARERGLARAARLGRGGIVSIRARDYLSLVRTQIASQPWFLTVAGCTGRVPRPVARPDPARWNLALEWGLPAGDMAQRLARLRVDVVGDGIDALAVAVAAGRSVRTRSWPTGATIGELVVPEWWCLRDARAEDATGHRLWDLVSAPHAVVPWSSSFSGNVDAATLAEHLCGNEGEITPGTYAYQRRRWELHPANAHGCARVHIDAVTTQGELTVLEVSAGTGTPGVTVLYAYGYEQGWPKGAELFAALLSLWDGLECPHRHRLVLAPGRLGAQAWRSSMLARDGGPVVEVGLRPGPHDHGTSSPVREALAHALQVSGSHTLVEVTSQDAAVLGQVLREWRSG